ncbi:MAG: hypothetical protein P4N59_09275 [Negativicutes bacterium]|nr:hypothetical protein [Negativicutes bacterium]
MAARSSGKEDVVKVQADIRDEIDRERLKRYQREQRKSEELEEAFRKLGVFSFSPVDYTPGLIRKEYTAPVIPDYSYLLTEARLKVVNRYYAPIITQLLLGLVCVIVSLAFRDTFVPILGAAGLVACAFSLHTDLRARQRKISQALAAARTQIDTLVKEAKDNIENAYKAFMEAEEARVDKIQKLLNGDPNTVFERLEEILQAIKLPFFMRCTIDFYDEPMITMHLPEPTVIPPNTVVVTPAGNITYNEKSSFELQKQYSEALAGTAVIIASLLYAGIPTLNTLYIHGLFDKWQDQEYLFSLRANRQEIIDATACRTAFEAFHLLSAEYSVKTSGAFSPIQPIFPDWWEKAPREKVRTMKVACQQL